MYSDYSAELIVSAKFCEKGWNVYFPHRDEGFDFIVTKNIEGIGELIIPVQVKGKYPESGTGNRNTYGHDGKLSKVHPEMVLAIPYYSQSSKEIPECIAYMPMSQIKESSRGYRCNPASFKDEKPCKREYFKKFFDDDGLSLLEDIHWKYRQIDY
ncbi:hypothetical protein G8S55_03495 [Clostridium botulinum C]|uniref:hypothetical protein n=1 Tax=Clostridium botulinum TaxID=1491 RepID=UPI001E4F2A86|nr:hypothetical protein [Clostridium botulinum]MCD3216317.1 hypothetical protein [Clostridium botulinum C]